MLPVLSNALKLIKPSAQERSKARSVVAWVTSNLNVPDAKICTGGSIAKDTWLAGLHDIDFFVLFDYKKYKKESTNLPDILEEFIVFKTYERVHGSRDYFQTKKGRFLVEIIPVLEIQRPQQALNTTDVSPLHAEWVNKNTAPKLKDEIRLLKAFCKGCGVYGAESYIGGFSGYLCEILAIHYGCFMAVLRQAVKWPPKIVIDPEAHYPSEAAALKSIGVSRAYSPLVLVDPVDKKRNAAAALTRAKLKLFKKKCSEFLKQPALKFFVQRKLNVQSLKKKTHPVPNSKLIILQAVPVKGKQDVAGTKLLKAFTHIKKHLLLHGFTVYNADWYWDPLRDPLKQPALFWFYVDKDRLQLKKTVSGPPKQLKHHAAKFRQKYGIGVFEKGSRLFANIKREYVDPEKLILDLISSSYVRQRTDNVKLLDTKAF